MVNIRIYDESFIPYINSVKPVRDYAIFTIHTIRHICFWIPGIIYIQPSSTTTSHDGDGGQQSSRKKRKRRSLNLANVDQQYCVAIAPAPPAPTPTLGPGIYVERQPVFTEDSLEIGVQTVFSKCQFWNPENETWEGDGCHVSASNKDTFIYT